MVKLTQYKQIARRVVESVLHKLAQVKDHEVLYVVDEDHGHYLVMTDGWEDGERSYGPIVHIHVKEDGKVWLLYDGTDLEIGQELLDLGVAPADFVPAFHSPAMRQYTSFAAA